LTGFATSYPVRRFAGMSAARHIDMNPVTIAIHLAPIGVGFFVGSAQLLMTPLAIVSVGTTHPSTGIAFLYPAQTGL